MLYPPLHKLISRSISLGTAVRTVEVQKQIPAIGSLSYSRDFSIIRCSA